MLTKEQDRLRRRVEHAASNEIGKLPAVKNPKRKAECKKSLYKFLATYCTGPGGFLKTPPSEKMRELIDRLQEVVTHGGRTQLRIARGHGKSSITKGACLFALLYGYRKFVVDVAAKRPDAASAIDDIFTLLEIGEAIGEDFPEVCVSIRKLERITQRARAQTYNGKPTRIEKTADRIILPTITRSAASGAILVARGFSGASRGLIKGSVRPDLLILDDVQTEKVAKNPQQVAKYCAQIDQGLLGLGGHDKAISAVICDTPICPDDVSEHYAQSSSWLTFTYPMILSEPDCWQKQTGDLWHDYFRIRQDSIAAGEPEHVACNEFYAGHRAEMDAGGEVINPEFYDHETELSGLQHAMDIRFQVGPDAFSAEYLMRPTRHRDTFSISAPLVASRINVGKPEFWVPPEAVFVACATDLNPAVGFSSVVTAFDRNQTAHILHYDRYTMPPLPIRDNIPDKLRNQLITQALVGCGKRLATICREHGIALNRWGIDCGGKQWEAANNFARVSRQVCGIGAMPMAGRAGRNYNPYVKTRITDERNATVLCGDQSKGWRWLAWNADSYKETAQKAWLGEVGTPGGATLYDGSKHGELAAEMAAEALEYKVAMSDGRTDYRWRKVGAANHYLDAFAMCYALAGAFGISSAGYTPPPVRKGTKGVVVAAKGVVARFKKSRYVK